MPNVERAWERSLQYLLLSATAGNSETRWHAASSHFVQASQRSHTFRTAKSYQVLTGLPTTCCRWRAPHVETVVCLTCWTQLQQSYLYILTLIALASWLRIPW